MLGALTLLGSHPLFKPEFQPIAVHYPGNQTLEGCAYNVVTAAFGGFYPPVKSPPAVNIAEAGSAVPVKFSLGGDAGLSIFAPGYPASHEAHYTDFTPTALPEATMSAGKAVG